MGTGNLSNIVSALYYAVQNKANVPVNMSFDPFNILPRRSPRRFLRE